MEQKIYDNIKSKIKYDVFGLATSLGPVFEGDVINEKFSPIYCCRYYQKYFDVLVQEIFDLSKKVVLGLNEFETWLLRKKYGIFDNGRKISNAEIADSFNKVSMSGNNVSYYLKNISNHLKKVLAVYGFDHFLVDIKKDNVDINTITFGELFPFEKTMVSELQKSGFCIVGDLCNHPWLQFHLRDFVTISGDSRSDFIKNAQFWAIVHRFNVLGIQLPYNKEEFQFSVDDYKYEKHISCLNLDKKIIKDLEDNGIHSIGALYCMDLCCLKLIYGIGVGKLDKIINALLEFDMNFKFGNQDEVALDNDLSSNDNVICEDELSEYKELWRNIMKDIQVVFDETNVLLERIKELDGRLENFWPSYEVENEKSNLSKGRVLKQGQ